MKRIYMGLISLLIAFSLTCGCSKDKPSTKKESKPNKCKQVAEKRVGLLYMLIASCGENERLILTLPLKISYNKRVLAATAVLASRFVRESLGPDARIGPPLPGAERVIKVNEVPMKVLVFTIKVKLRSRYRSNTI